MGTSKRVNVHLFVTDVLNESRLFKEAANSLETGRFAAVHVLGVWENGLRESETHPSGLRIERVKALARRMRRKDSRAQPLVHSMLMLLSFVEYGWAAVRLARRLRPSHVSVHNPMLLPIGVLLKRFGGARLIYLPHELEAEREGLQGWMKRLFVGAERRFIGKCDAVVAVCQPIGDWYRAQYDLANVHVVRNMPRTADVRAAPTDNLFRKRFNIPDDRLIFIYQGLVEEGRGCRNLVESFRGSGHHLVLMGYGAYAAEVEKLRLPNVHHQPAVPIHEIVHYSSSADVGLVVLPGKLSLSYACSLPNKFFEYAHANLPIIVSDNLTYMASIVRQHQIGWATTSEGLAGELKKLDRGRLNEAKDRVAAYAAGCVWETDACVFDEVYADAH